MSSKSIPHELSALLPSKERDEINMPVEQHLFGKAQGATFGANTIIHLGYEDLPQRTVKQVFCDDASNATISGFFGIGSASLASQIAANRRLAAEDVAISIGPYRSQGSVKKAGVISVSSLDVLYKRVAPNAILNARGRADEVKCYPGTRGDVLGRIEDWRDSREGLTGPTFWLSGPAGAGKSAIVQTIAERCITQEVPQANFFFFRSDNSRNTASSLVATILYQIIELYPSIREMVAAVISSDPLIFDSILEHQISKLIVAPLHRVQNSSHSYRPLVLLIDGLDECDPETDQRRILYAFGTALSEHTCPFRLLVASRVEPQITMLINQISPSLIPLYLDHKYAVNCDIRLFVTSEFQRARRTHPLGHTLPETWPSAADIEGIVQQSSGQFSYAATVMRTILSSPDNPRSSLERLQGVAQTTTRSSFSHADTICTYILSRADDQQAVKNILHAHCLRTKPISPEHTTIGTLQQTLSFYDRILRLVQ